MKEEHTFKGASMSINLTAAMLEANLNPVILHFAKQVATSSTFLEGVGGISGDGYPIPFSGYLTGLQVWDGTTLHTCETTREINAGDRLCAYAIYASGVFNVSIVINGNFTTIQVLGLPVSSTYQASLSLLLARS